MASDSKDFQTGRRELLGRIDRRGFCRTVGWSAGGLVAPKTIAWAREGPGRTFYVDANGGDDRRDGLSPAAAWKSLERVNRERFRPGDSLLLRRSRRFKGSLTPRGSGNASAPILVDAYGEGPKPRIEADGRFGEALLLDNQEYWEINNLHLSNLGEDRAEFRYGVKLRAWDHGTVHHIYLRNLDVHDVNGSLIKNRGEGQGIVWENGGDRVRSRFDGLLIEGCHLLRTDRNGISGYSRHSARNNWFPSLNVVIRRNLLEDIGGDCIKPWGCDGTLVEGNIVRKGRQRCLDAAAGIWPWCCDNTLIQHNEVGGIKGVYDGQAFDTDGNCRNTIFQYNYSYDNDGGFMLMCNDGGWSLPESDGTSKTIIRYNISRNDRTRLFHFDGPTRDTLIHNNVFWTDAENEVNLFLWTDYRGWAEDIRFVNNIVYCEGTAHNSLGLRRKQVEDRALYGAYLTEHGIGESRGHLFRNNAYWGNFEGFPEEWLRDRVDPRLVNPGSGGEGFESLEGYRLREDSPCIGAGFVVADAGNRDFWGNPLPEGGPPSIGAHQP